MSYQLYIWPRLFSIRSSVETVSVSLRSMQSVPMKPISRAHRQDSIYIAIFVGEVRRATIGPGSACTLSGGR